MKTKGTAIFVGVTVVGLSFAVLAAPVNLTGGGDHDAAISPSVSVEGSHRWVAWVEYTYNPGSGAEDVKLQAARYLDQAYQEGPLDVAAGWIMNPVVLSLDNGDAWFIWIQAETGGSRLKARKRGSGSWQSAPFDLSPDRAGYPSAHLDGNGDPWVVWEAYEGDDVEIRIAHWTGSAFSQPETISEPGVPAHNPALEVDTLGGVWAVWQAWFDHNYDIFARRRDGVSWGPIWPVTDATAGSTYLGMHVLPTVAHGANGVAWIGWLAKGAEDKWFSGSGDLAHLTSHVRDRQIQIRRMHPNGDRDSVHPVPVPANSLVDPDILAEHRGADRPVLKTARGKVMVFYRLLDIEEPDDDPDGAPWNPWRHPIYWRVWMQHLDVGNYRWTQPFDVGQSSPTGGYAEPVAVARTETGVLTAWQQDAREEYYPDGFVEPVSDVWLNEVPDTALGSATTPDASRKSYIAPLVMDQPRSDTVLHHLGEPYRLLFGDLHSHTLHSADAVMKDDQTEEDFRRARDLVGLDFYAVTDHGSHLSHHDWFRHRLQCRLHDGVGGMAILAGLEVTQHLEDGHQNVIYDGCDGDLLGVASQPRANNLWAALPEGRALTIPHNSNVRDLRHHDPRFKRLFEIYQWRGSIECYDCRGVLDFNHDPPSASTGFGYFQNALAIGQRLGVIASPDHPGFFGVAAVYATSGSQQDIFDALFNRRTFGVSNAAARMALDFRADGRLMGEEYELHGACPVFHGRVRTDYAHPTTGQPGVIEEVKIYRVDVGSFGQVPGEGGQVLRLQPNTPGIAFTFHDADCPGTGSAAYYLRAIQSDVHGVDLPERPSIAWTSPVFVDWTPGNPSRNAAIPSHDISGAMSPSGTQSATVTVQNAGDIPWTGKEAYLLSVNPGGLACDPVHLGGDEYVLPGQNHDFQVTIDAPAAPGTYTLVFQMDSPAGKFGQMLSVDVTVGEVVCVDGDTRLCGTDVGACESGLESCAAAAWGPCTGGVGPQAESCNGLDDDCDGAVPAGEADADADGYRICEGDCGDDNADVNPGQSEAGANCADGLDNDCDGDTDLEDPPCSVECSSDAQCSDGNVCNGAESCDGNQTCQPGTALDCDDGNPCTDDTCDPVTGCASSDNSLPCDDGDACTMADACEQGTCSGEPLDADGDGHVADACGGPDCDDADSAIHPGVYESGTACQDGMDNDCDGLADDADPGCMSCSADADCRDENQCNGEESCAAGACQPGVPLDCDDGDPCTDDRCAPATGCEHASNASGECADEEPEIVISGSCGCGHGTAGPGLAILGLLVLVLLRGVRGGGGIRRRVA